jgi:hypothetical protein
VVGGPAFLAPELLRNESGPSKEGDVYALGIVIIEGEKSEFARVGHFSSVRWIGCTELDSSST